MVSYRPLGNAELRAFQFIITLDLNGVNVLVDAGWDESLSQCTLSDLVEAIPKIDLILLTHATSGHTGAFCYLRHNFPQFRSIPAYATLPVIRMSQTMTLDLYRSAGLCGPFDGPDTMTEDEVEAIWSEVHSLKYSQPLQLRSNPKLEGTMITAYNSGHSLGGSLWKIDDSVDSVVIALDWNHARDAHLSGAFLEPKTGVVVGDLQRPSLFITSTHVSSGLPLTKCRQQFLDNIDEALKHKGTVLIPTSNGSRILELILILEKHMRTNHRRIPLIYCSRYGKQALSQASSMLEWMVPSIISDWQVQNESPFDTSQLHYCDNYETIQQKWPSGPRVILSFGECLESGPSKEIFVEHVACDEKSSVIISEICPSNTLGEQLLNFVKPSRLEKLDAKLESVVYKTQKPLSGEALAAYNKKHAAEREEAVEAAALERRNQQLIDTSAQAENESSESDEDYEEINEAVRPDLLVHDTDSFDYKCLQDQTSTTNEGLNKGAATMFPFIPKRRRVDDYGAYLPAGLFLDKTKTDKKKQAAEAPLSTPKTPESVNEIETARVNASSPPSLLQKNDEQPMCVVSKTIGSLPIKCRVAYADMNGITNVRSLQMIVKQIQPSRTIALPGSMEVCNLLSKQCPDFKVGNEIVTFTRTNFSVDVRIDPTMNLIWHDLFGGYSVARVSGNLQFDPHDRIKKSGATLTSSDPAVKEDRPLTKTTIGDFRLTSLRKVLTDMGLKAEFRSQGVLVCNDRIIVRKTGEGSYLLEGGTEPEYYTVRAAIRRFIAIV